MVAAIGIYQLKRIARCIMHARICMVYIPLDAGHRSRRKTSSTTENQKFIYFLEQIARQDVGSDTFNNSVSIDAAHGTAINLLLRFT